MIGEIPAREWDRFKLETAHGLRSRRVAEWIRALDVSLRFNAEKIIRSKWDTGEEGGVYVLSELLTYRNVARHRVE